MSKKNLLVGGAVGLAVGITMVIHGNIRSSSFTSALIAIGGGMPPGGGEMILGVLIGLGGVISMIMGAVKKEY